jgi:hypothetical protein
MASFGFSIGDIVLISKLALNLYNASKQAGQEFQSITDDGMICGKNYTIGLLNVV